MHKLLADSPGEKMLLLGNHAISRGVVEAGVACVASYPGTPSSEISDSLFHISKESELYFEYSVNEKVCLEVAVAAANSGIRSMGIMKHVGLNVAADVLLTLAYIGVNAGLVVITAGDPYMFSSQNEQDNRYYGRFAGLVVIEPASVAEAKEMIPYAFEISEKLKKPVIFRTTTRINHSTAVVKLGKIIKPNTKSRFVKEPGRLVPVPANARKLHAKLLESLDLAEKLSGQSRYNYIKGSGDCGIICSGVSCGYVADAVSDLKVENRVSVLNIGFSYPLPVNLIKKMLIASYRILVVEEGEPLLEQSVREFAQKEKIVIPICGKEEGLFSKLYEYNPKMVRKNIAKYFDFTISHKPQADISNIFDVAKRPPNLCAGCSHRAVFYAVKKATKGMDVIFPTDIGCYTLGFLPPLSMGDILICMGSSVGTSCGFSIFSKKKVVAFIGDSTFFHSGIQGLVNAVFNNHDFTLVILDNGTTAMTGHQPNPGIDMSDIDFKGHSHISIENIVKALGVNHVFVVKPYNIKKSIEKIKEAVNYKGISVIIFREKCILYQKSLKKLKKKPFYITDRCKKHMDCIKEIACPAFYIEESRVKIDAKMCSGCAVCAQICPEHAISPVV